MVRVFATCSRKCSFFLEKIMVFDVVMVSTKSALSPSNMVRLWSKFNQLKSSSTSLYRWSKNSDQDVFDGIINFFNFFDNGVCVLVIINCWLVARVD